MCKKKNSILAAYRVKRSRARMQALEHTRDSGFNLCPGPKITIETTSGFETAKQSHNPLNRQVIKVRQNYNSGILLLPPSRTRNQLT